MTKNLKIISGKKNILEAVDCLIGSSTRIIAVTLGKQGTLVSNGEQTEIVKSINVKSIDSTVAGDAFIGAVLYKISLFNDPKGQIKDFNNVKNIVSFGNKVGALVCTKLGAISALPTLDEVENK